VQNNGNFNFTDVTDKLYPVTTTDVTPIDRTMQKRDIDNSGINSYMMASRHWGQKYDGPLSRQSNYLMLNDGTGKLHIALHDEFLTISKSIIAMTASDTDQVATFMAYQTTSGKLNYVARIDRTSSDSIVVNVPLQYSPTLHYKKNIIISDRNKSKRIRTFAGDDIIHDTNSNTSATIDGGNGTDTVVYSGLSTNYKITKNATTFDIENIISGNKDTLKNVERAQFTDKTVDLK
jgi:hypothetical protein